jgi:hypothetical protein
VTSAPGKKRRFSNSPKDYIRAILTDLSDERLTIPKSTVVGLAEEIGEEEIDKLNPRSSIKTSDQKLNEALLVNKQNLSSPQKKAHVEPVLKKFSCVFYDETPIDIKATPVV